eukprot:TRINITY_DN10257_c0_g1_i3.p1 TRINITY_DN10257_c0_g1~~TRINITY_DN10257_c0_g1_i3.p1  ORF type:complete len:2018 (+),score=484.22 TRINITY_DN10257_c0_g1_i3:130-6183(+)
MGNQPGKGGKGQGGDQSKQMDSRFELHKAAYIGQADVVAKLLQKGANANAKDDDGRTPLYWAVCYGRTKCAAVLLDYKAETELKDDEGMTVLHKAVVNGHIDCVKLLLSKNAEIEVRDNELRSPLHLAAYNGDKDVATLLIEKGAKMGCRDREGRTPLHYAGYNGHKDFAQLLVEKGSDINSKDKGGRTALAYSANNGHVEVLKILLAAKADLDIVDGEGKTAYEYASHMGQSECIRYLNEAKGGTSSATNAQPANPTDSKSSMLSSKTPDLTQSQEAQKPSASQQQESSSSNSMKEVSQSSTATQKLPPSPSTQPESPAPAKKAPENAASLVKQSVQSSPNSSLDVSSIAATPKDKVEQIKITQDNSSPGVQTITPARTPLGSRARPNSRVNQMPTPLVLPDSDDEFDSLTESSDSEEDDNEDVKPSHSQDSKPPAKLSHPNLLKRQSSGYISAELLGQFTQETKSSTPTTQPQSTSADESGEKPSERGLQATKKPIDVEVKESTIQKGPEKSTSENEVLMLRVANATMKKQIEEYQLQAKKHEQNSDSGSARVTQDLTRQLEDTRKALQKSLQESDDLKRKLAEMQSRETLLQRQVEESAKALEESHKQKSSLQIYDETQKNQVVELQKQIASIQESFNAEKAAMCSKLDEKDKALQEIETKTTMEHEDVRRKLEAELQELRLQTKSNINRIKELEKSLKTEQESLKRAEKEKLDLLAQLNDLESEKKQTEGKITQLEKSLKQHEEHNKSLETAKALLEQRMSNLRSSHEMEVKNLREQMTEQLDKVKAQASVDVVERNRLLRLVEDSEQKTKSLESEASSKHNQIETLEKRVAALQSDVETRSKEQEVTKRLNTELESTIQRLQAKVDELSEKESKLSREFDLISLHSTNSVAELKRENENMKIGLSQLIREKQDLERRLEEAYANVAPNSSPAKNEDMELKVKLQIVESEKATLSSKLQTMTDSLSQLEDENRQLRSSITSMQSQTKSMTLELSQMSERLATSQKELSIAVQEKIELAKNLATVSAQKAEKGDRDRNQEIKTLKAENARIEALLTSKMDDIKSLQIHNEELKEKALRASLLQEQTTESFATERRKFLKKLKQLKEALEKQQGLGSSSYASYSSQTDSLEGQSLQSAQSEPISPGALSSNADEVMQLIESDKNEIHALKKQLTEKEQDIGRWKQDFDQQSTHALALKEEIDRLKKENLLLQQRAFSTNTWSETSSTDTKIAGAVPNQKVGLVQTIEIIRGDPSQKKDTHKHDNSAAFSEERTSQGLSPNISTDSEYMRLLQIKTDENERLVNSNRELISRMEQIMASLEGERQRNENLSMRLAELQSQLMAQKPDTATFQLQSDPQSIYARSQSATAKPTSMIEFRIQQESLSKIEDLEKELLTCKIALQSAETRNSELLATSFLRRSESLMSENFHTNNRLKAEIEDLKFEKESLMRSLKETESFVIDLQQKRAEATSRFGEEIVRLQREISNERNSRQTFQLMFDAEKTQYQERIATLEGNIESQRRKYESQLRQMTETSQTFSARVSELGESKKTLEAMLDSKDDEIMSLTKDMTLLKSKVVDLTHMCEQLRSEERKWRGVVEEHQQSASLARLTGAPYSRHAENTTPKQSMPSNVPREYFPSSPTSSRYDVSQRAPRDAIASRITPSNAPEHEESQSPLPSPRPHSSNAARRISVAHSQKESHSLEQPSITHSRQRALLMRTSTRDQGEVVDTNPEGVSSPSLGPSSNLNIPSMDGRSSEYSTLHETDVGRKGARESKGKAMSLLHQACLHGHVTHAMLLVQKGESLLVLDENGRLPIHLAAHKGHQQLVEFLLDASSPIDPKDKAGRTPLYLAASNGYLDCVDLLLQRGAYVDAPSSNGTALHKAAFHGHWLCVQYLVGRGANIHAKDNSDATPLHKASYNGHVKCLQVLLDNGADVDLKDSFGATALHKSAYGGHTEAATVLLKCGADIHAIDKEGGTALHYAAFYGHAEFLGTLLLQGAKVRRKLKREMNKAHKDEQ